MDISEISVGQTVVFGRERGQKTRGRVFKVNRKSVGVEVLEARGKTAAGTKWKVSPALCSPVDEGTELPPPASLSDCSRGALEDIVEAQRSTISALQSEVELLRLSVRSAHVIACEQLAEDHRDAGTDPVPQFRMAMGELKRLMESVLG